jgi:methyl-accepting chemotaxis protein
LRSLNAYVIIEKQLGQGKKLSKNELKIGERIEAGPESVSDMRARYHDFNKAYGFRKVNPVAIYAAALIISLIWAGLVAYYVANGIYSTGALLKMLPHEFGGFLAGTIMPIGFVWMIALYIDRNVNSNYEQKVIYPFLQSIIDPAGDTSVIVGVVKEKLSAETEALKSAVGNLKDGGSRIENASEAIKGALENADRTLGEYSSRLEESALKMARNAADMNESSAKLLVSGEDAEERAQAITRNMLDKTGGLASAMKDALSTLGSLAEGVAKTAADMDRTISNAETRNASMARTISESSEKIAAAAEASELRANQSLANIDGRTNEFIIKANISAEKISAVTADIAKSVDAVNDASNSTRKLAMETMDKTEGYATFIAERLAGHQKSFSDKTGAILAAVAEVEKKFATAERNVRESALSITGSFGDMAGAIAREKQEMAAVAAEISESAGLLGEKMREMVEAGRQTIESIKSFDQAISSSTGSVVESAQTVAETIGETGRAIDERTQALKGASDNLADIANKVSTHTRLGEAALGKQGEKMAQAAEDIIMKIGSMDGKIANVMNGISDLASRMEERFGAVSESLVARATSASRMISESIDAAASGAATFKNISQEFSASAKDITAASGEISRMAGSMPQISNMSAQAKEAAGTLASVSDGFSRFVSQKESELAMMSDNATKVMTTVANYANKLSGDIGKTISAFKEMSEQTGAVAGKMSGVSAAASGRESPAAALNHASFLIERLESLSIDLARVLAPDAVRDLWNRHLAGNKVAFAKHLNDMLSKRQVSAIREQFANNPAFAEAAKKFVAEFDSMVLKIRVTDKSEVMLATLTSTDMGRAYIVLKEVLK